MPKLIVVSIVSVLSFDRIYAQMAKPAYPFQIARIERLRELLAANSASIAWIAEGTPALASTDNEEGKIRSSLADQAAGREISAGPQARAGRNSPAPAEDRLELAARLASEISIG